MLANAVVQRRVCRLTRRIRQQAGSYGAIEVSVTCLTCCDRRDLPAIAHRDGRLTIP